MTGPIPLVDMTEHEWAERCNACGVPFSYGVEHVRWHLFWPCKRVYCPVCNAPNYHSPYNFRRKPEEAKGPGL